MSDDPIKGFGERIIKRARLPTAFLLALPLLAVATQYFFFLIEIGFGLAGALEQLKKDIALFGFLSAVPAIALAFARELQVHQALDKLLGTRRAVDQRIATLMAELADSSGYAHPERIRNDPASAREWFYSYVNQESALRTYVFEVWEGYYVGLYLWLASGISLILCLLLMFILERNIALTFAIVCALIFLAVWAVRRWSTIPKIMQIPVQQIKEIRPSGSVLSEARRRFG